MNEEDLVAGGDHVSGFFVASVTDLYFFPESLIVSWWCDEAEVPMPTT